MTEESYESEQESITQRANDLLLKLNKSYVFLQKLNKDIESRPFSTRLHGHFDHELKKSQSIIAKLSDLLRKYHSFEFSSNLSLDIKTDDSCLSNSKPIDRSFIIEFKDICLKIEREWRIGTKQIMDFDSKYPNTNSTGYHSDTDRHHRKHRSPSKSGTNSPIHSFSNPNSPLFSHKMSKSVLLKKNKKIPRLNIGVSQSQILKQNTYNNDSAYNQQIGSEFVPFDEEHRLNQQIRDINDSLQHLLDINKDMNDLVREQSGNLNEMENSVSNANDNVAQGMDTLTSIRKSPMTYAVLGGIGMAVLGGPLILIGAGVKAAIGGSIGLGTVGALGGVKYANGANDQMNDECRKDKEQRLLNEELEKNRNNYGKGNGVGMKGFKTKPRKRNSSMNSSNDGRSLSSYFFGAKEEEEIETWDARN